MKRRRPRVRASQAHIIDVLDRDPVVRDDHQRELLDRSHPVGPISLRRAASGKGARLPVQGQTASERRRPIRLLGRSRPPEYLRVQMDPAGVDAARDGAGIHLKPD